MLYTYKMASYGRFPKPNMLFTVCSPTKGGRFHLGGAVLGVVLCYDSKEGDYDLGG